MKPVQEDLPTVTVTGNTMQLGERHGIAIYQRDGRCRVAEFPEGRGELVDAASWLLHLVLLPVKLVRLWQSRAAVGSPSIASAPLISSNFGQILGLSKDFVAAPAEECLHRTTTEAIK